MGDGHLMWMLLGEKENGLERDPAFLIIAIADHGIQILCITSSLKAELYWKSNPVDATYIYISTDNANFQTLQC